LREVSTNPHTRNFFNSIGDPDDVSGNAAEILKIAISPKFIRYFLKRKNDNTIVFYGDYALQSVANTEDIAAQLSNILSKDSFLNKTFDNVKICWYTDFEIIPTPFFDANELAADTAYDIILNGDANFIFDVPKPIHDVLKNSFGIIEDHHSGSSLINKLSMEGLTKPDKLFINIQSENIEIVYFDDNGGLRIYNRYEYKAYQDYIYFVLLVADEMKIDREEVKAVLMGEVSQDSQLYEMTQRYFRNISFIAQPQDIQFSRAFQEYPKYFNYPLYNL
jgi:hypothetical protein